MKESELERQLNLATTQPSTIQPKKKKTKSRKKGINSRAKGGRVERELVAWLKERGIASAERTAQRCGKGGPSDVVAKVELPSFHIEVKGTAGANISKSTLIQWLDQVERDCVKEQIPIIFHKANGKGWSVLIQLNAAKSLQVSLPSETHITFGDSFNPSHLLDLESSRQVYRELIGVQNHNASSSKIIPVIYCISPSQIIVALWGSHAIHIMKWFENKAKGIAA